MNYVPKKHQEIAADFLRQHRRSALFLDMGLGKTVITLTHIKELIDDFAIEKALVIAPKRVAEDTWSRESAKWDHLSDLRLSLILGDAKHRKAALEADADVYIINRENVCWLIEQCGKAWPFDAIVVDELSSFKSSDAKRWRMLKRVAQLSPYFIGLTGTPAPNGYLDLWPQVYLIDGGEALGKFISHYRNNYFDAGAHNGHIVYQWRLKRGAKAKIDAKLSHFCLSMSKEDWLTLPPVINNEVHVHMDKAERLSYDKFMQTSVLPLLDGKVVELEESESAIVGDTAAVLSNKLLQMANGAVYDENGDVFEVHDRKLDAVEELIEAAQGQPVLCFYTYRHDLSRLRRRFPQGREFSPSVDTVSLIRDWNEGKIPLLFAHPASAGHGLNLQEGGHIIVWFGLPWSLEQYQQANARLYRQGQTQSVIIHHIICDDTVDEKVLAALNSKDATQRSLLDALKGYIKGGV